MSNNCDDSYTWGFANVHRKHMFVPHYVYELPFFRGARNSYSKVFGGWQVSGITDVHSGSPAKGLARAAVSSPPTWSGNG